jgi:outer membrane protein
MLPDMKHAPSSPHPRWLLGTVLAIGLTLSGPGHAGTNTLALGVGIQRMPSWPGADSERGEPLPYIDIEVPDRFSVSTLDGLQIELLHDGDLRGGIYGDYQWGRDRGELGMLGGKIASLSPRLNLGGYLEWQLTRQVDVGVNLSHDINGAGAYLQAYAEWDLPAVGLLQHSIELHWQGMNARAMNRFFGLSQAEARALDVRPWRPGGGSQLASLEYDLFLPTSQRTGVALALVYGRLFGGAGNSPLVTHFGSRTQLSESLAFVYHL